MHHVGSSASTEILFTALEAAKSAGITELALRALEPDGFGSPGHWRMAGNKVVYTERGIELLVESLTACGCLNSAAGLYTMLVKERQARAVPSRSLIPPGDKGADPYYRTHPTLS